jgi:hypothetical protein
MNKTRIILFGSVIAAAMIFGGVMGATVFARANGIVPALAALAATSPSPTAHSNEGATHEQGESAAQEQAENNGTFRPGRGGHPCGGPGHSNEASAHETSESAAVEAAENAACPSPSASTPSGG